MNLRELLITNEINYNKEQAKVMGLQIWIKIRCHFHVRTGNGLFRWSLAEFLLDWIDI